MRNKSLELFPRKEDSTIVKALKIVRIVTGFIAIFLVLLGIGMSF